MTSIPSGVVILIQVTPNPLFQYTLKTKTNLKKKGKSMQFFPDHQDVSTEKHNFLAVYKTVASKHFSCALKTNRIHSSIMFELLQHQARF